MGKCEIAAAYDSTRETRTLLEAAISLKKPCFCRYEAAASSIPWKVIQKSVGIPRFDYSQAAVRRLTIPGGLRRRLPD
jgi:hypothetical protein